MRKLAILTIAILAVSTVYAEVIFQDNFDGYNYSIADKLNVQNPNWQGAGAALTKFVSWNPGRAYFSNGTWGDNTLRQAYTNVGEDDYTVSVDAFQYSTYTMEWYATARATDTQYIAAGVVIGTDGEGIQQVYARLIDSTGYATGDYWLAVWDPTKAVTISLTVDGDQAVANFVHDGMTQSMNYTTTILTGANAGFGGKYQWNYPLGSFDNFVVESVPEPATMALLGLGGLLIRRKRK